jgi:hypothetical protein
MTLPHGVYHAKMIDRPTKDHLRMRVSGDVPSPKGWRFDVQEYWVPHELRNRIQHLIPGMRRAKAKVLK